MNRSSAILLLCAAGASINCSQANPTPTQGAGTAGASPSMGGATGSSGAPSTTAGESGTSAGAPGTAGAGDMAGAPAAGGTTGGAGAPPGGGAPGTAGAGTAGAGSAGAPGTAGAGGGGGPTVQSIVPTLDGFLWVGTCGDANSTTKDCPIVNDTGASCTTSTDFFVEGAFKLHTHKVGGTPGTKYMINFEARGITGGKTYNGGMKQSTDQTFNQTGNDGWYAGGLPTVSKWNTYEIHVTPPVPGVAVNTQALTCPGCPTPPDNVYYTNSLNGGADGTHETFPIKFTASFPVLGGGTITLIVHDSNCLAQQNCGPNPDQAAMCDMPRSMDLTGLTVQPPAGFKQPYTQTHAPNPWYPQWLLFNVKSVTQP
jgi:hypothetical protein